MLKSQLCNKYVLANIVVIPRDNEPQQDIEERKVPARNKFLTPDIWESFVYRQLFELFRKQFDENDKEPLYRPNTEYQLVCNERPYLQMKFTFRDIYYRNILNTMLKESCSNLHDTCIYVEISDQGRAMFDKVENLGKTIQRLTKENKLLKRECTNAVFEANEPKLPNSNGGLTSEVEEYHPQPVKKSTRNPYEEYVPVTRNGTSPGIKRTYKPSKIADGGKLVSAVIPDPYTPGTIDTPMKITYTPTSSPQSKVDTRKTPVTSTIRVEKNLFGSDDDDEYDPACPKSSEERETKIDCDKDMFADMEQPSPGDDNDKKPLSSDSSHVAHKREVLPRSSKQNIRGLLAESPEEKPHRKASKKPGLVKAEEESQDKLIPARKRKHLVLRKEGSLKKQKQTISELDTTIKRLSKMLNCVSMSKEEILGTFLQYKKELHGLYLRHKDHTERQWKSSNELCYFTEFGNILDDEQKFAMMQHLEDEFVPEHQRGKYTEFFTSALVMEWGLRIFMERHNFASREMALDRIKQQEISYIASLSDDLMLKYH
uniref:Uncharacterized protein n=1 Tax=Anopheles minimus TaxID=112268 RepID=A0A182W3H8_9DIPT